MPVIISHHNCYKKTMHEHACLTKYQDLLTSSHCNVTSWLKLPLKAMATGSSSKFPKVFKYYDVATKVPQGDFKAECRFWLENRSKFPILAEVAREVLRILLSSSPVERLFSIAGKVFGCCLTDARFQELMLIIRYNN